MASFNSSDHHHHLFLQAPISNNYEALQYYSPMTSSPDQMQSCHDDVGVEYPLLDHSPSTYNDYMVSSLQPEESCNMLLADSDHITPPASSAFNDPMDIMLCDIWSLVDEPPSLLDATHTQNEVPFQEYHDLQLPPPPSPPANTIQAHCATAAAGPPYNNIRSSLAPHLENSSCEYIAKKPSEIVSKPVKLSSSAASQLQRNIERQQRGPISDTGGRKDNAEKVDNDIAARMSKNLISERKRRKKVNDKLYSLRALVPKISKMDKASIVSDAIKHVQDLQKQMALRQKEIAFLQLMLDSGGPGYSQHKVLKMDVVKMAERTFQVIVECIKEKCVVLQLTRALEALNFSLLSANITSIGNRFLNTLILEANILESKELTEIILEILPKFGLTFM